MAVEIGEVSSESGGGGNTEIGEVTTEPLSATEDHGGSRVTIAPTGDYSIDTREADGTGDVVLRLKAGATLKVEIGDKLAMRMEDVGGWLRIELGDGAEQRLVLGDKLLEVLNRFFQTAFDLHVHPTPMGPSGPPLPPFVGGKLDESVLSEVVYTK